MHILVVSGFFESELPSYREYSYCQQLAQLNHHVTLMCGDQSQIWSRSRIRLPETNPTACDDDFVSQTGVRLLRRKVRFRYSDFVLYWPAISAIREADVVHIIEFRTGVTVIVAILAKLMKKPVIYDHEQRGDRLATWYSRIDSVWRRFLIRIGANFVDIARHTGLANRDHFISCTSRNIEMKFSPLGVDSKRFYFNIQERISLRARYGIPPSVPIAVMSGKLHDYKRVPEVVDACRRAGIRLILVGTISRLVETQLRVMPAGDEIILHQVNAEALRAIYSTADIAIFTTFTLSYWEAHATGITMLIPDSEFSRLVFEDEPDVERFGEDEMFVIPDEEYVSGVQIGPWLSDGIERLKTRLKERPGRESRLRFSAATQARKLAVLYRRVVRRYGATESS